MRNTFLIFLFSFSLAMASKTIYAQDFKSKTKPVLNHIAVFVVDLKRSTDFYHEVIQLDTIPEPFHDGRHTWFAIGPLSHLHLIQGEKNPAIHEKDNHLCFTVSSVSDFIKILDNHKIEYESWTGQKMQVTNRVDGVKQIYFKDPDGFWIEINDARD